MASCKEDVKTFNMRMPKDMWMFLKKTAASEEQSMTDIMMGCLEKYRKKMQYKLTREDTNV